VPSTPAATSDVCCAVIRVDHGQPHLAGRRRAARTRVQQNRRSSLCRRPGMKLQPVDDLVDHLAFGALGQANQIEIGADHGLHHFAVGGIVRRLEHVIGINRGLHVSRQRPLQRAGQRRPVGAIASRSVRMTTAILVSNCMSCFSTVIPGCASRRAPESHFIISRFRVRANARPGMTDVKSYPLASQAQARITHSLPPNS
jgi:hypothetical protein